MSTTVLSQHLTYSILLLSSVVTFDVQASDHIDEQPRSLLFEPSIQTVSGVPTTQISPFYMGWDDLQHVAELGSLGEYSARGVDDSMVSLTEKDWWGAMAEITVVLLLGELLYVAGQESMEEDFDYELDGNAAEYFFDRLTTSDSWKLDDNGIGMNWGHTYAGAVYFQAFRNYNFNYYESTFAALLASSFWEVFAEYKEVVSINDQIMTTWGGASLGESFFQVAELLDSKEGWLAMSMSAIFNPSQAVRGWINSDSPARFNRSDTWDKYTLYSGVLHKTGELDEQSTATLTLGMKARVDSMKGNYDRLFGTPSLVNLQMALGLSERGVEDWELATDLFLGGYVEQVDSTSAARDAWSHRYFIGASTGAEYVSMGQDEDEDFYAVINLLGLSAGRLWHSQDISIDLRGDIYGDFAMVKPFASRDYIKQYGHFWGSKSVLWERGYSYALGHTIKLAMDIRYLDLMFGASIKSHRWDSIDNKDIERTSDWNPNYNDLDFKEQRTRYRVYFRYVISNVYSLSLNYEQIEREGEFNGIDNSFIYNQLDDTERRTWIQLEYSY
ncbi:MAG: DUF3943 domain-containing protein [Shewanella sp.]